ncbi:outer membrane beta-barrel protein [Ancylobacter radicis]|uniref:Outer membrane beta-barrel protein n=1 Tax=Ancylobacter radicis TaxID=2836179 RepID=A0ABS5R3B3_9HYPH|nr:outer membrane beta-barrel protein [Ancylobacter radicis]MBS9475730.1 outer membrane beta-barrel protein [Ancylobacter radicis]
MGVGDRAAAVSAPGIALSSFSILPSLYVGGGYNDNITATNTNEKADWILTVKPAVTVKSDWTQHYLGFDGYFQSGSYAKYSDADYQNYSVGTNGRLDMADNLELIGYARFSHLNELPGDDETDTGLTSPLPYDQTTAGVGFRKQFNRMWTRVLFDFRDRAFDDAIDGVPTDQSYRDGQDYKISGRVGYDISPLTSVFVGGSYGWAFMDDPDYNAEEYEVITGFEFQPSRLTRGEIFIGYKYWDSEGDIDSIPHFTYGANLDWFATPLLTINFNAKQEVLTSNFDYAGLSGSSVLSSTVGIRGDYEWRRNILLSAWFSYQNQNYEDYPRDDDQYVAGAELRYLYNRYATFRLTYNYTDYASSLNGVNGVEDYQQSVVSGGIVLTY